MNSNDTEPTPAPESPAPRKRGRPAFPPGQARSASMVVALRPDEHERAKAWAKGMGKPLGDAVRSLLLPLIGAVLLVLCTAGTAGCGTVTGASVAGVVAAAKPVLDVGCAVVERTCDAVEAACTWLGSGGEAPAVDAGAPDAGL